MSTCKCKACGIEKPRIFSHLNKQGRSLYKDDKGIIWMGKLCPECNAERVCRITGSGKPKEAKLEVYTLKCMLCKVEYQSDNPYRLFCTPEHAKEHKDQMTKKYGF
jgi:hypothetical protein